MDPTRRRRDGSQRLGPKDPNRPKEPPEYVGEEGEAARRRAPEEAAGKTEPEASAGIRGQDRHGQEVGARSLLHEAVANGDLAAVEAAATPRRRRLDSGGGNDVLQGRVGRGSERHDLKIDRRERRG